MTGLKVFESPDFGGIRLVTRASGVWFVAADVCRALEHSNVTMALERLDDDEKAKFNLGLSGGYTNVVNEPGLYTLILGSRKPEARAFKRWITHEVLPAIRTTGGYFVGEREMGEEELLARALQVASNKIREKNLQIFDLEMENSTLSVENRFLRPKADYFDAAMSGELLTGIRETAKLFGIGQKELVQFLISNKYAYRNKKGVLLPYETRNRDYFEIKEVKNSNTGWFMIMFRFTPKGRAHIFQKLTAQNERKGRTQ